MQLLHFHTLRTGVQANASPSKGQALIALESVLRDRLKDSGLFDTVEVEHTHDTDRLLAGICQYRQSLSEHDVLDRLEEVWEEQVAYPFWEAHAVGIDDGFVEFEAATRERVNGPYVTVHLIAEKSSVPSQRVSRA